MMTHTFTLGEHEGVKLLQRVVITQRHSRVVKLPGEVIRIPGETARRFNLSLLPLSGDSVSGSAILRLTTIFCQTNQFKLPF